MELYLQYAWGMKEHCKDLIGRWKGGTVILNPRNLEPEQLTSVSNELRRVGGQVLLDPQQYEPRSTHERLSKHKWWINEYDTGMVLGSSSALQGTLKRLGEVNTEIQTSKYILPSVYAERVDDEWLAIHENITNTAAATLTDKARIATICLSAEALRFDDQLEDVITAAEQWDVSGYYIVPAHPGENYLINSDVVWLRNLLILCASLKLQGREVIVGSSSHQMLCMAAANVDAITSSTHLTARFFNPVERTDEYVPSDDEQTIWYYCPQALCEYPTFFLNGASPATRNLLKPIAPYPTDYLADLFTEDLPDKTRNPNTTNFKQKQSFRHYLHTLHKQASLVKQRSFIQTFDYQIQLHETAGLLMEQLRGRGARAQDRDFSKAIDVNLAALATMREAIGYLLEKEW